MRLVRLIDRYALCPTNTNAGKACSGAQAAILRWSTPIFMAAVQSGEIMLAVLMALASVIAVYYYLRIVWMMTFEEPTQAASDTPRSYGGALASVALAVAGTVIFGILPDLLPKLLGGFSVPFH